jgi:hypothetical protein
VANFLLVDDSYTGQTVPVLTRDGRDLPVAAATPASMTPRWQDVLGAGAESGLTDPRITWGSVIYFDGQGVTGIGGFLGIQAGDDALVLAARETTAIVHSLWLLGADSAGDPGGNVRIAPGSGVAGSDGSVFIESVALGPTITVDDSGLAFFDGVSSHKPSVTGSRAGNAALASLLSRLANMGLITDNTTP